MNYEQLWNDLKEYLEQKSEMHKNGSMQSKEESYWGYNITQNILSIMNSMENNTK